MIENPRSCSRIGAIERLANLYGIGAIVSLLLCTSASAQCVGPDQKSVQAAVGAATYGDKIQVCGGPATWSAQPQACAADSMLCIKKGISLEGGIGGTTTITLSGSAPRGAIVYEPDSTSGTSNTPFEFTGFVLVAGASGYGEGMLNVTNRTSSLITRVKIHHNTFRSSALNEHAIVINLATYGVAYSNTFIDIGTPIKVEGGDLRSWALGHRGYGTGNSFFFEDNAMSFTASTPVDDYGVTAGQGGSLVYRYNTWNTAHNPSGNEMNDLHGLQSMTSSNTACNGGCSGAPGGPCYTQLIDGRRCADQWSQVKSEFYGNKWTNLGNTYGGYSYLVIHRGSWMLMFNNDLTGTYSGSYPPQPKYRQYACDESQNPATPAYSQHIQNTYVFNNFYNGANQPMSGLGPKGQAYGPDYCSSGIGSYTITEDIDYFNLSASFDGTSGVGCGSLAFRPSTCTTGVGYWATNQSCTNLAGMVGASPATPLSGTLYKCTATNTWTSYYTPYTYPHPLRGPAVSRTSGD